MIILQKDVDAIIFQCTNIQIDEALMRIKEMIA